VTYSAWMLNKQEKVSQQRAKRLLCAVWNPMWVLVWLCVCVFLAPSRVCTHISLPSTWSGVWYVEGQRSFGAEMLHTYVLGLIDSRFCCWIVAFSCALTRPVCHISMFNQWMHFASCKFQRQNNENKTRWRIERMSTLLISEKQQTQSFLCMTSTKMSMKTRP
jgi:hypothetical protein